MEIKIFTIFSTQVESVNRYRWTQRKLVITAWLRYYVWKEAKEIMKAQAIELYAKSSAWWSEDVYIEWLKAMLGSRPRPMQHVMLLLDDFYGHWTSAVLDNVKSIDLHLIRVPPSCTATCQSADIAWNSPLKSTLRSV